MVMNIHYECTTLYNTIIVQYGMHVYQYKIRGVPVNSNPPAVTCMSALDEMIPVAQICLHIWAITEIDLMTSQKNIPAGTNLPAFIYVHTVMHTLVVVVVTLVVNSPLH